MVNMKSAIILAGAALAAAQNFSGQPSCATSCLSAAITGAGCSLDDAACQCGPTQSAIAASAAPCLLGACPASDLFVAQSAGSAACAAYSAGSTGTITSAASTTTGDMSTTLAHSGDTIIGVSTNTTGSGSVSETKTLDGTVATPTVTNTAEVSGTGSTNVAPTAAPAKIVGGVLAGLMGVVVAL